MTIIPEKKPMIMRGHHIDVVFCIDGTGSMSSHMNDQNDQLDEVKHMVSCFILKVADAFKKTGRTVESLRAKVIVFRDFGIDDDALVSSRFFSLPHENDLFQAFLQSINAVGGGDEAENGLEALAEAMNSEWDHESRLLRQIIVLFTGSSAHPLEDSVKSHAQYPRTAPSSFSELCEWWENGTPNGCLKRSAKRLLLYAPNADPWDYIAQRWGNTFFVPVENNVFDFTEETQDYLLRTVTCAV